MADCSKDGGRVYTHTHTHTRTHTHTHTVMQIEKALINDQLLVSKVSGKISHSKYS